MMEGTGGGSPEAPDVSFDPLEPARVAREEKVDATEHPERYLADLSDNPMDRIKAISKEIDRGEVTRERSDELKGELQAVLDELREASQEANVVIKKLAGIRRKYAEQSSETRFGTTG